LYSSAKKALDIGFTLAQYYVTCTGLTIETNQEPFNYVDTCMSMLLIQYNTWNLQIYKMAQKYKH